MHSLFVANWFVNLTTTQSVAIWTILAVVAVLGGLFALKIHRDFRREDEATARKHARNTTKRHRG